MTWDHNIVFESRNCDNISTLVPDFFPSYTCVIEVIPSSRPWPSSIFRSDHDTCTITVSMGTVCWSATATSTARFWLFLTTNGQQLFRNSRFMAFLSLSTQHSCQGGSDWSVWSTTWPWNGSATRPRVPRLATFGPYIWSMSTVLSVGRIGVTMSRTLKSLPTS